MANKRVIHLLPDSRAARTFDGKPPSWGIKADSAEVCVRHGLRICATCAARYADRHFGARLVYFHGTATTP